jgi:hypothetical protein
MQLSSGNQSASGSSRRLPSIGRLKGVLDTPGEPVDHVGELADDRRVVERWATGGGASSTADAPSTVNLALAAARRYAASPSLHRAPGAHAQLRGDRGLVANPYTGTAAALFYAASLLVAAWRGQPACEVTVLSNLFLRRDDQIGYPVFAPIDVAEARRRSRRPGRALAAHD